VLGDMFRGKFVAMLRAAFERGALRLQGGLQHLLDPTSFAACLDRAMATPWVVYSKPPFGGPLQVLKYLARYTHRVAIGNRRILEVGDEHVQFRCRDRAKGNRPRVVTLPGVEFLRRFLLHVLPRGFPRIRHYGLLANRSRAVKLAICRFDLGAEMPQSPVGEAVPRLIDDVRCPACKVGRLVRHPLLTRREPAPIDSS
jgi:hypothetical protein